MMRTDSPAFAVGMMLAGLAAGMIWYGVRLKNHRMPVSAAWIAALLGPLLALICAKAGYLLHDLGGGLFDGEWDEITEICAEKLSFVGGCAGMIAGVVLAAKISGIRPGKALDLFAAPGCVFLCLARIAEGGMDTVGVGDEVEAAWLQFFPMTMQNGWGGAYLSVFVLEALTALVCLIPALQKREEGDRAGLVFERTAVYLLGAQIGWEMLLQYPYIRTFMTSFVSLEQVQIGDLVYVTNPWETLTYRVIATGTISPSDLEQIRIQPGKDLLSIFTCTYPNTRRVLVTCERIFEKEDNP